MARKLLRDFSVSNIVIQIRADNQGAITIGKDLKASAATKHIATAYHLTRAYITQGAIELPYILSVLKVADSMTKSQGKLSTSIIASCLVWWQ